MPRVRNRPGTGRPTSPRPLRPNFGDPTKAEAFRDKILAAKMERHTQVDGYFVVAHVYTYDGFTMQPETVNARNALRETKIFRRNLTPYALNNSDPKRPSNRRRCIYDFRKSAYIII
jgi:hypothetical protein